MATGDMHGKVIIVTGASRGIGRAIAIGLARAGAAVVATARTVDGDPAAGTLADTAARIQALGGEVLALRHDVGSEADAQGVARATLDRFGRVDALVNNAGVMLGARPSHDYEPERFDRLVAVHFRGVFLCCRAVLPAMLRQRAGIIVNMSSGVAREVRVPGDTIYAACKAAAERYTMGLAAELAGQGIAAVAVTPGAVATEGTRAAIPGGLAPAGWQAPEAVLPAIQWLLGGGAMSVSGRVLHTPDFGLSWP
ncbi:MAG: SDR family NAD(P)-dependent oxidoreductase [Gammaproteobacteria bacterium]